MGYGHTPKSRRDQEKINTEHYKKIGGNDFSAKIKSTHRNAFRDFRKEMGKGSASLRRALKNKQKLA